jgi:hypothetical protein
MTRDYFRNQDSFRQSRRADLRFLIAILAILFLLGLVGGMEMRDRELQQHIKYEIK